MSSAHRLLFDTLDRRMRPEDVARLIRDVLPLNPGERKLLAKAASNAGTWSSMSDDFARPSTMATQLAVAKSLFAAVPPADPADMVAVAAFLEAAEEEIGKRVGASDFKRDRLSRAQRTAVGVGISKRQYNKRFRLACRMESKRQRIIREHLKRSLTLASKSRLSSLLREDQLTDPNTLALVAYYVARCNLRSVFTNHSQVRPYDEICDMLMNRCRSSSATNWFAIAHVLPDEEVLRHIDAGLKGQLLGQYFTLMEHAAELLREVWEASNINRETMVVRRGNDSTTWNVTAGAWNKLRAGWFALLFSLGLQDWIEAMCPGKVLRLMAADVAAWHRLSGGSLHSDTGPWCDLPLPWEVIRGEQCPRSRVLSVCEKWKVDPIKSGWVAPPPEKRIATFTPTPELVHGVEVESPQLAALLRKAGVFSGKSLIWPPANA
jgi:hypothetical protein